MDHQRNESNRYHFVRRQYLAFDVAWLFNDKNQLTIQLQNTEIFNFSAAGIPNSFTTRDTALVVKPDRLGAFTFTLQGDWDMTPDHNLAFTVGGIALPLTASSAIR